VAKEVLLAAVIGAQGLKGEVKAKVFTATPDSLPRYGVLHTKDGRKFSITAFRTSKEGEAVIAFEGIRDRNAAEALKGTELFVSRDALPEADDDEFYHADLIGLEAQDSEGRVIGKISALHNFGAGDVMEISLPDGDHVLIAFTRETVPTINVAEGFVMVAVPEDDEPNHVE
jgi:16S rRNA processing protein RimM